MAAAHQGVLFVKAQEEDDDNDDGDEREIASPDDGRKGGTHGSIVGCDGAKVMGDETEAEGDDVEETGRVMMQA